MNVVASPLTGVTGVTVITGVMLIDQFSSMPLVPISLELVIWSVQTPGTHRAGSAGFFMSTVVAVQG